MCQTADPGVESTIPARSYTFVEIDHEIISTVILLPSAESFKIYKQKWEPSGSKVECLTLDLGALGLSLTGVTVLWSLSKTIILA